MKIIRLQAENFKRLKAVDIRPGDDPLVKITGKNMAGKTSILDVILAGLKGGKAIPGTPIRKGEDKGGLLLDLGDYEVIRNFTPKGNYLKVYSKPDGIKVDSPQDFLNSIIGSISFDPMEFVLMSKRPGGKKEQRELILQLAGVDTTKIDAEYATYYSQRTEVGRDVTRLKGALASKVYDDSAPAEEQKVTELSDKLQKGLVANNALNQAKQKVVSIERELVEMEEALVAKREELIAAQNAIKGRVPIDLATIQGAIKNMEAVNTKVRGNKEYLKVYDELELAMKKYDKLSTSLDSLQNKKVSLLKAAKMPLEG
ncbi:MAG: AAA family ATPase, partial [Thermodesulfovibrionales bacterium]